MTRALLVALVLAASSASAQIVPTPGQPLDLAGLVAQECGPAGYRPNASCTLDFRRYPKGRYPIEPTALGTCDSTRTTRIGLTIIGHGSSIGASVPTRYATSSTTFVCTTGTCISICGSDNWLRDLNIEAYGAEVGVEFRANNSHSAITHFGGLERVIVRGAKVGARIFGETYNDQLDFLVIRDSKLIDAEIGFEQDSQQAVANTLENVEVTARERGIVLRNGGLEVDGGYVGQWKRADGTYAPDFIGYHGTRSENPAVYFMARALFVLRDFHAEIHDGYIVRDDSGSSYPLRLESVQFQHLPQTPAAAARLWSIYSDAPGALVLDGISATSSTPSGVTATPRICRKQGPPADVRSFNRTPWMGDTQWKCPLP